MLLCLETMYDEEMFSDSSNELVTGNGTLSDTFSK